MSLGEFVLCGLAQSGNILNLEENNKNKNKTKNLSYAICSGNVPLLTKRLS